jgi:hypothetical protein
MGQRLCHTALTLPLDGVPSCWQHQSAQQKKSIGHHTNLLATPTPARVLTRCGHMVRIILLLPPQPSMLTTVRTMPLPHNVGALKFTHPHSHASTLYNNNTSNTICRRQHHATTTKDTTMTTPYNGSNTMRQKQHDYILIIAPLHTFLNHKYYENKQNV